MLIGQIERNSVIQLQLTWEKSTLVTPGCSLGGKEQVAQPLLVKIAAAAISASRRAEGQEQAPSRDLARLCAGTSAAWP